MRFPSLEALSFVGFDATLYGQLSYLTRKKEYPRSQEVAEGCAFLGADGLLVPSARAPAANNLIVFCEQETQVVKEIVRNHGAVDLS